MQDIDFDELDRAVNSVISPSTPEVSRDTIPVGSRPASTSPAARRSSGRFMDVVHPSSDMRPQTTPAERPAEPVSVPAPEAEKEPTDAFKWPDPIDLTGTHSDEPTSEPESPTEEPQTSLDSPFLPGAKVEKRPLGSPVSEELVRSEEPEVSGETYDEPPTPAVEDAPIPVELHEELVKLEEGEAPEPDMKTPEPAPAVETPSGPTSITQQYKEQPSSADQSTGAIYDTESYHQPLAHPEKKHSSILVIVWILALILVGGGMGAAVYFFVLPML